MEKTWAAAIDLVKSGSTLIACRSMQVAVLYVYSAPNVDLPLEKIITTPKDQDQEEETSFVEVADASREKLYWMILHEVLPANTFS